MYPLPLAANVDHLPVLIRMDKLIRMLPPPLFLAFFDTSVIDVTDNAARWYPYDGSDNYYSAYDVVL